MSSPIDNNSQRVLIVNYHYVAPPDDYAFPGLKGVSLDQLESQLRTLKKHFDPIHIEDFPLSPRATSTGRMKYLVTFDDAFWGLSEWALSLLDHFETPTIIFCCSQPYLENRVLNVQKTHLLHGLWGWEEFQVKFRKELAYVDESWALEDSGYLGLARMYRYDDEDTAQFKRQLNVEIPYSVVSVVLDRLFVNEFGAQNQMVEKLYLSTGEIQRCADLGLGIGFHTHSHPMLSRLSLDEQEKEFNSGLNFFRDDLGVDVSTISYPYGITGSWNKDTKSLALNNGLKAGFTLGRQIYDPVMHQDNFEIPRYDVNDVFDQAGNLTADLL